MADMILVVAEHEGGSPRKITYELLNAARDLAATWDYEVAVAVMGDAMDEEALAASLGAHGAEIVFALSDEALAAQAVEPATAALQQLIEAEEPEIVLLGQTALGRGVAPRLAAALGAGLVTDATGLRVEEGELLVTHPIYSGQAIATLKIVGAPALVTLRPNTWRGEAIGGDAADVEAFDLDELPEGRAELLSVESAGGDRPDLSDAARVVSGGRGFGGPDNFHLLEALADTLDAAVGTTRAVVDADWRPYDEQVGQTGKTISPQLYVAIGLSGAIQHLSGMRTSKTIVAINKDADAPIFRVADYGIVADLFEVVPLLTEELQKVR